MNQVEVREVAEGEDGIRLDRWFKRHFPALQHGRLEKLLRTGQIRLDGHRAKANTRLEAGQSVRIPPISDDAPAPAKRAAPKVSDADIDALQDSILYMDDEVIALNKAPGLAVQGGTKTHRHIDGMLDALQFGLRDRPRLVHRLDRDTSGVLLIARTIRAASELAAAFKAKTARKIYWAAVAGQPRPAHGVIDLALDKQGGPRGERVVADEDEGQEAITKYRVVDHAGDKVSWLVMEPLTGRTHQLRVHAQALGTPILGDPKYGERDAGPRGADIAKKLHLHARAIRLPRPGGEVLEVTAPLPAHMVATWRLFGFDERAESDPFGTMPSRASRST
jgi:23S rRNA pseudouridine955/2504/2580 synthase